jgi:putative acetyltransferase
MIIREATVDDALAVWELHGRSVLELCSADYTREQLDGWLSHSTIEKYQVRLKMHRSYIAERDGKVVGYVRWNPVTNELCSAFVDPDHARQGIATELMEKACQDAISCGVKELWLNASLTAVPFYEAVGWEYVKLRTHGPLECVRMTKRLQPRQDGPG